MDHDTGIVVIFVIFFALLSIGILLIFIQKRRRKPGDGYDLDDVLKRHSSWLRDVEEDPGNPANPSSPFFYGRQDHHD